MMKKLIDSKLVEFWMKRRKVKSIIVKENLVIIEVSPTMSEQEAETLLQACGHSQDYRAGADGKHCYIILPRF